MMAFNEKVSPLEARSTLNRIADPERQMYLLKYRDRRTYEAIGKLFGYSPSGIFMRMDHALDEL